ncbi:MAG: transposase [Patescibacteria group bacterium]
MNREKPKMDQIYHVYNRGVEKRKIFLNNQDHYRFIHDLYEFNDANPAVFYRNNYSKSDFELNKKREPLVEILAFCMMPNHFHLMLRQIRENGITDFMRKLGTGYANYFNKKYERVGSLFQGKYKTNIIKKENQYIYLPYYIHFNPLKLMIPNWKEDGIKDFEEAINFLEKYKWSSYLDFTGNRNFPYLINKKFVIGLYGGSNNYKKSVIKWLRSNHSKSDFEWS